MTDQEKREKVIKPIRGYEGLYAIDNFANVYSVRRDMKILVKRINPNGYEVVSLCRGGKCETKKVHRLVAEAFIPNPDSLPYINHKDENKTNNIPDNLEWCTPRYNILYNGANKRAAETKRGRKHTQAHKDSISAGVKAYYSTHESKLKGRHITYERKKREAGEVGMTREEAISKLNELIECTVDRSMIDDICYEIIEFLEAQEPRVMTLEEVKMLDRDYYYLEAMRSPGKELREIVGAYGLTCVTWPSITWARQTMGDGGYGKTWRCWTSRPTDEQREREPWDDAER